MVTVQSDGKGVWRVFIGGVCALICRDEKVARALAAELERPAYLPLRCGMTAAIDKACGGRKARRGAK